MEVILRDLRPEDAKISYKWRNDPEVWKLTGRKWNNIVTEEIEKKWIKEVSKKTDEKRYAICIGKEQKYIGNIQLTGISEDEATFHIFIGEKEFWGQGIGTKASLLLITIAKRNFGLKRINLFVKEENQAAIKIYEKVGFQRQKVVGENTLMTLFL